jgi:Tfp pilus assembly protein PilF
MEWRVRLIALCLCCCRTALAGEACPPYTKGMVGGDYRNAVDRAGLSVVEQFHFTPQVEHLVRGTSGSVGADISYTLEHYPNHPGALSSMARLALRSKTAQPAGAKFSAACFFSRAIGFRPDDAQVRSLFGAYLLSLKQNDAALLQFEEAARLAPDDAVTRYNLGLLYVRSKDYDKAREAANAAYAKQFPLPGLRNQLKAAGQWRD